MTTDLAGVDLKIRRAESKIADLKKTIEVVTAPDRYHFSTEIDPKIQKYVYRVHGVPFVRPKWSLQIGEILYQLRSALDHLAWQLVLLDGGTPGEETQFPIRDTPLNKNGNPRPLKTLLPAVKSSKILRLLDECQPYVGPKNERLRPFDAHATPPWHLKTLNNVDKHRLLLVVVCILDLDTMLMTLPAGTRIHKLNMAPLEENSPVAWFDCRGESPPEFYVHPSLQIVMRESDAAPALSHIEIIGALEALCSWVEDYVVDRRFRPLFP